MEEAGGEDAGESMRLEIERMLEEAAGGMLAVGDEEYGRQMWSRCEALTAGAPPYPVHHISQMSDVLRM